MSVVKQENLEKGKRHTIAVAVSLELSDTVVRLLRLVALSLGTHR